VSDVLETITQAGVVPIVEVSFPQQVEGVLSALRDGGLAVAEIVLRTPAALHAIALAVQLFPDVLVGAGTVRSEVEAIQAIEAGAQFVACPVTDANVIARCQNEGIDVFPGTFSPTEIRAAMSLGVSVVKYFPADVGGGPEFIRAVAAPMPEARLIPTGGVTLENLEAYLRLPQVVACGTSAISARGLVESDDFAEIALRAQTARAAVCRARPELAS
jgi:2-dehydro-3-deoxyphosphogluconate aldolase / (4S)-4-hydroxy-2-oxoglutarate aldolase